MSSDILYQARTCVQDLKTILSASSPSPALDVASTVKKVKELMLELTRSIETTSDPLRLEELLEVNDELVSLSAQVPESGRPVLTLQGLGKREDALALSSRTVAGVTSVVNNGQAFHESPTDDLLQEEDPLTPRIDKGKARAEPEPEKQEKVLSPNLLVTESESEDEDGSRMAMSEANERPSPTDR